MSLSLNKTKPLFKGEEYTEILIFFVHKVIGFKKKKIFFLKFLNCLSSKIFVVKLEMINSINVKKIVPFVLE